MADTTHHRLHPAPTDWHRAFAALPLEAPDRSQWSVIEARLPIIASIAPSARASQYRQRMVLAMAASLALVAPVTGWWLVQQDDEKPVSAGAETAINTSTSTPRVSLPSVSNTELPSRDTPSLVMPSTAATSTLAVTTPDMRTAAVVSTPRASIRSVAMLPVSHPYTPRNSRDIANRDAIRTNTATINPDLAPEIASSAVTDLETLYRTSAQLEQLLALARDTRVESGPAAALASDLDVQLATIDANLADPALKQSQQQALWQARVDTLQQATRFESHLRLLAAEGSQLDGALVSLD